MTLDYRPFVFYGGNCRDASTRYFRDMTFRSPCPFGPAPFRSVRESDRDHVVFDEGAHGGAVQTAGLASRVLDDGKGWEPSGPESLDGVGHDPVEPRQPVPEAHSVIVPQCSAAAGIGA